MQINWQAVFDFASHLNQKVFIFPARHSRIPDLPLETLLAVADGGGIASPGVLFYTQNMPIVLNRNVFTDIGLVNGTIGIAKGVILDPHGK